MDIEIQGIDCSLAASEVDRIIYLAVSLVDPEGEKLKKMTTPPHQVETPPYPVVKRQMTWYGRMLFSVGGRDLLDFQLMLRSKAARPDVSLATARVPISDLRSDWGISCELLRSDGTNYGDLSFVFRTISINPFFPPSLFNCLIEFEKDESELANSESRIPNPPPDLEKENAMDIEVRTICCYELGISFDSFYFAVSLVAQGGEALKKLVTPRSPVKGEEGPAWRGRMPFAVAGQDRLEIELVLRNKVRGDVSMGSASVLVSDLRSLKSVRGIRCPLRTVGTLGFSYRIVRYAPRDPHARSSSSPAAAIVENCRVEFENVVSTSQASAAEIPQTHQSDRADLAHIIETAGKSLRSSSQDPESAFEEDDDELIFDTAVGKIDLSNCQVMENKDIVELKELGRGAFGTVYHGKWRGTDVAIKRINKNCLTGQRDRMILESLKEAGILASLLHPNIVTLYGFVLDELESSNLAIVTELVADGSLKNILLHDDKYLDRDRRLIIAKGAASGMEYLHLKKVVHFDLKCDNLLVDLQNPSSPICKVADFGLSKVKENTLVSGGFRGTIPWMAPELLKGDRSQVSEKVDVFSFGIVMWEILTGKVPYAGMLEGEIIGGIFNNTLRPPVPTSCEPRWRRLMEECWASDPQQRPSFTQIGRRLHSMSLDKHAEVAR